MEDSIKRIDTMTANLRNMILEDQGSAPDDVRMESSEIKETTARSPSQKKFKRSGANLAYSTSTLAANRIDIATTKQNIAFADLQALYSDLLQKYRQEVEQKDNILQDAKRKDEVSHRREARFREQIQRLEDKVTTLSASGNADNTSENSLFSIRSMHKTIQENITLIQSKTTQILKDQERDLLRAFKARMTDVNDELTRERRKNESGSSEWVQRCHKLTEELEWMKDMTYRMEEQNKTIARENKRLKSTLQTQEHDREFLIKQILSIKKENSRLRELLQSSETREESRSESRPKTASMDASQSKESLSVFFRKNVAGQRPSTSPSEIVPGVVSSTDLPNSTEERYQRVIRNQKRHIELEEKRTRQLRQQLNAQLNRTNDLQKFMTACIEDVKKEIEIRTSDGNPEDDMTKIDRQKVLDKLFAQEKVLQLFYDHAFLSPKFAKYIGALAPDDGQLDDSRRATNEGNDTAIPLSLVDPDTNTKLVRIE